MTSEGTSSGGTTGEGDGGATSGPDTGSAGSAMGTMDLGAFSVSLAVADLAASKAFYEKLGFVETGGSADEGWLIMVNQPAVIGLFSGMFDKNILTFNPGLVLGGDQPETFTDVREIQARLEAAGLELGDRVDKENPQGPAHVTLIDPDGNPILIDQHR